MIPDSTGSRTPERIIVNIDGTLPRVGDFVLFLSAYAYQKAVSLVPA
jgi:hypothetical protein